MNFDNLFLMAPEVVVAVGVIAMVILDIFINEKRLVAGLGVFSLVAGLFTNLVCVGFLTGAREIFWMYAIDSYSCFFKYLILAAGIICLILASGYKPTRKKNEGEFYFLLTSMVFAMMCLVSATDLILVYVLFEFVSLTSYIMVGLLKNEKSSEGALKYFLLGAVSSGIMVFGMSYVYGLTGTTNLLTIGKIIAIGTLQTEPLFILGALFMLVGFCFKAALVPVHFWSPDAYEGAPTPVTAILSVAPKCAAFALFGRIFYTIFPEFVHVHPNLITMIGVLTMTLGNTAALWQTDIKRMFAYSSIAQAGYIFIGIAAGAQVGFLGMLFYLAAYIFMNLGAFAVIVTIVNRTGSSEISRFAGLAKNDPFLAAGFLIFVLALAGIPPTSGFLGKYLLFRGAIQTEFYLLALCGVINSVISVFYYFDVVKIMYFAEPDAKQEKEIEVYQTPFLIKAVVAGCLAFTLFSGLFPNSLIKLILERGIYFLN